MKSVNYLNLSWKKFKLLLSIRKTPKDYLYDSTCRVTKKLILNNILFINYLLYADSFCDLNCKISTDNIIKAYLLFTLLQ